MDIYHQGFQIESKQDGSPVTIADRVAEKTMLEDLSAITLNIPVVAEEAANDGHTPSIGDLFFPVDPLDGTKEFIQKSDEFTVNIALIDHGVPIFGLVYAPALERLYVTISPTSAFVGDVGIEAQFDYLDSLQLQPLITRPPSVEGLRAIASKSHMAEETRSYLEQLTVTDLKSAGSSLKFCLLAEGKADIYPRFEPTMEWDTAAGPPILQAAGGEVLTINGAQFCYGKVAQNFLDSYIIARAQPPL